MLETRNLDVLGETDAALISALLDACEASQTFIETKFFRRDHYSQIDAIERLEKHRYLLKERVADKEYYRVSLTAMVQLAECQSAQDIMATAELLWNVFREHYEKSLDQPITLKTIADSLGLSIEHVTRVHTYMREWWNTPSCFTPADSMYQAVTVREDVLGCPTFAGCVQQLRDLQTQQMQSSKRWVGWHEPTGDRAQGAVSVTRGVGSQAVVVG